MANAAAAAPADLDLCSCHGRSEGAEICVLQECDHVPALCGAAVVVKHADRM